MKLSVKNFGPIKKADIELGDITVFVGPQASGKTLAAQLLVYFLDTEPMIKEMKKFGYSIVTQNDLLDAFFTPEGSSAYIRNKTKVVFGGKQLSPPNVPLIKAHRITHSVLYVPAQRSSLILGGYPLSFESLPAKLPFPVRFFSAFLSEQLRLIPPGDEVFPRSLRFKETLRKLLHFNILMGSNFVLDKDKYTQRLTLYAQMDSKRISLDAVASGLRESLPILLSIQEVLSHKKKKFNFIIEEPETNLHPNAIKAIITLFMHLVHKDHKLIITTHSPFVLELIQFFKLAAQKYPEQKGKRKISNIIADLLDLHGIRNMSVRDFLPIDKDIKVYFFHRTADKLTEVKDISDLTSDTDWGGLSSFTVNIADTYEKILELK